MPRSSERIACLDGLRALSIALVVLGHVAGTRGFPLTENVLLASLATLGVRVFFVISGFLITGILLGELGETGRLHLGRFYFRRTMRIFVPYYAFLAVVLILERVVVFAIPTHDLAAAATYTSNYNPHAAWQLAHTWSLSVEEQFYLLWPAGLALLGRRRALVAAALVVVAAPLLRMGEWQLVPALRDGVGHRFETCADALAMGCLLAGLRRWLGTRPAYLAVAGSRVAFVAVAAFVVGSVVLDTHPKAAFLLGWSLQNVGIAFLIDGCLRHPERRLVALLSSAPLVLVGKMSYAIYLWQQLFLDRESTAWLCRFPVNLLCVAALGAIGYYAIDLTSLALRHRLEKRLFRPRARVAPVSVAVDAQQ